MAVETAAETPAQPPASHAHEQMRAHDPFPGITGRTQRAETPHPAPPICRETPDAGPNQPPATPVGAVGALAEMCSLISGEDIATIIDKDLAKTEPGPDGLCSWTFTDSTPGAFAGKEWFVNVSQESDPIPVAMRQGQFALPNGEDVSIGDGGYWAPGLGVLYVQNGADVYDVQLVLFSQEDPRKDLATEIAQLVLAKV